MKKSSVLAWIFLFFTIFCIFKLANNQSWARHLVVDIVGQYLSHAEHFIKYKNLSNLGYNEYQPGAVMFFAFLSPSLLIQNSYVSLLHALFYVNIFLIIAIGSLFHKISGPKAVFIFSLILLATGPILLYRFDLLVGFLIILTFFLWKKHKYFLSMIALGFATLIKIYPILLLPYLLILALKNQNLKKTINYGFIFLFSIGIGLFIYIVLFQAKIPEIMDSLTIHSRKPVHVESVFATILTIIPYFQGKHFAQGAGNWGIFGISPEYNLLPLFIYNYFWIIPYSLFCIWLLIKIKMNKNIDYIIPTIIVLGFLVFSKILTPQYLFWFASFLPLLSSKIDKKFVLNLVITLVILILTQYIYPLNYDRLLDGFYIKGVDTTIFWILSFRNILLVVLLIRFFRQLKCNQS